MDTNNWLTVLQYWLVYDFEYPSSYSKQNSSVLLSQHSLVHQPSMFFAGSGNKYVEQTGCILYSSLHPNKLTCITPLLTIRTWAASIGNLWCLQCQVRWEKNLMNALEHIGKAYRCTKGRAIGPITLFFCATFTTNIAADPDPRMALLPTFRTRATIFNLCAYLQIIAHILIGPIVAHIRAPSNTAVL